MASLLRPRATGASPRSASADSLSSVHSPHTSGHPAKSPAASSSSSSASAPRDSSLIRFKVTRTTPDRVVQTRTLSLNTTAASLHLSAPTTLTPLPPLPLAPANSDPPPPPPPFIPDDPSTYTFLISDVADIEKCHCDRASTRAILVFFDDCPPPHPACYDVAFVDQTTRDIFCELVASMDRQIGIKAGCGGINTSHWVEDTAVRRCGRCGKEFGAALRRHHCRLCGRVFCWACSDNLCSLAELGYNKPVRVCGRCFDNIKEHRMQGLTVNGTAAHAGGHNYNGQHAPHNTEKRTTQLTGLAAGAGAASVTASVAGSSSSSSSSSSGLRKGSGSSSSNNLSAQQARHPHINTERLSDASDQERIETMPSQPSPPTASDDDSLAAISSPLTSGQHLFAASSSSPRGVTPKDGAFREGKRDKYGFIVGGEGTRGQDDRPYHRIHLAKQRKRWNQYLALHPNLESTAELRRLVRKGIPPELRGSVWQVLSGSTERQAAHKAGYYAELVRKAEVEGAGCRTEIEKDLRRTFPDNHLYESEEGLGMLRRVLLAYSLHNPTVGYAQSMNFICALCLLFMDEEQAFWLLTFIVEELTCIDHTPSSTSPAQLSYYYQSDLAGVHIDQAVFKDLLKDRLPRVSAHFDKLALPLGPVTVNWFLCLFVNTLPLETSLHVWDCLFSEGVKTLFRCALALMRVNEKLILAARDFEQVLLRSKNFHIAAAESSEFARVMFDDVWLGAFPMSRIDQLRKQHRVKIAKELRERAREMELNEEEDEGEEQRPSAETQAQQQKEGGGGEEERKREERKVDEAADEAARERKDEQDDEEADSHSKLHTSTVLSSSLRAQLRLSEAALADPFAAFSPTSTSPTSGRGSDGGGDGDESNVDPKYQSRFRTFHDYIGPEHNDASDSYYHVREGKARERGGEGGGGDTRPGEEEEERNVDTDDDADYVTVEKPRALSSANSLPDPTFPKGSPSLPSRGKSQSMSQLPPTVSGPHSRAMEARKRRTQSGQASPTGAAQTLFGGWRGIFNRGAAAGGEKEGKGRGRKVEDEEGDDSDDLPSPTPVSNYVKPPPPQQEEAEEEDEGKGAAGLPPRAVSAAGGGGGGAIFRRTTPTDSPTGTPRATPTPTRGLSTSSSFNTQPQQQQGGGGAGKGTVLYPRKPGGGGSGGGSVE